MDKNRFREEDFKGFLEELIRADYLDDPAKGITKYVIDNGYEALSEKQKFVFIRDVIDPHTYEKCGRCDIDIPWCEMFMASDNGGLCSWCDHMESKSENN